MASVPPEDGSILPFGLSWSDVGHGALDVVGVWPGAGELADLSNAAWYAAEGNYLDAGLSVISTLPIVGDVVGKGGRIVTKTGKKLAGPALDALKRMDFRKTLEPFRKHPKLGPHVDKMIEALEKWQKDMVGEAPPCTPGGTQVCPLGKSAPTTMSGGKKGAWSKELNAKKLKPNAHYNVNGYNYKTDAQGRVTSVEGQLTLKKADRNSYQQGVAGRGDRLPDDQGGHLVGSIFNGPGDRLNLVAMDGNLNQGRWKAMENEFASALKQGKPVNVKVDAIYSGASERPQKFAVTAIIDGKPKIFTFKNKPGG